MASIVSSLFGQTKLYEPSPRFGHGAVAVGGRCYLRGGRVQDFSESSRRKLVSTVKIFDPYLETWEKHHTTGVPPPGLYLGACTSLLDSLYWFGGEDGFSFYNNSLHRLNTTTLEWREIQPLNHTVKNLQADGPMRKRGCGMVSFLQEQLAVFGGYGIPTQPTQVPLSLLLLTFTKDTHATDGSGWSNELHVFSITESKWSSPPTTGPRPPPCAYFSFTAINNHQAVLFGGRQPHDRVSDCYLMDFVSMEWTKLERPEGALWPVGRSSHAACCLNYGEEHPQLLVTGGRDNNNNALQDAWILDVNSGRWRKLTFPEGALPRMYHTATALSLGPGRTQVTMFGGCPKWEREKSHDAQQKLAKTTVLDFESVWSPPSGDRPPTKEWVLVGVADSSQLGSLQRMREKMVNMQQRATREIEAGQQALQVAQSQQALDQRVQDTEARARDLQTQLEASQDACQVLHQSLLTTQQSLHATQQSLQRTQADKQALERALQQSQLRERALQERVTTAEQSTQALNMRMQDAEARARDFHTQLEALQDVCQELQQSLLTSEKSLQASQQSLQMIQTDKQALEGALQESQTQVRALQERVTTAEQDAREQVQLLQQRVQEAEQRAEEAERRAREAQQRARERERNPSWLVHREEINLTEEELGRGGWGVVTVATFRGARIAAKCLYGALNYGYWQNVFSREMNMAARIRHPNLLQFIGATLEGELIILTELIPTSLRAVLERAREPLPHQQISTIGLDVARALNYLHLMQPTPLIHRDVSSGNVLLEPQPNDSWKAKVSDYGSVNLLENLRTVGPGSPVYAAPEANIPPLQSPKMDIFSFGVLLVEMCTARFPEVAHRERLIRSIQQPDMVALIRRCLAHHRVARPSATDIILELSELHM